MSNVFNFQLQRYSDDTFSTLGLIHEIFTAGRKPLFWGYSLEDEHRDTKVKGDTRIWAGDYEISIMKELTPLTKKYREDKRFKDFFQFHLWIKNVRDFSGVYMHVGCFDRDTEACILMADNANNNQKSTGNDGALSGSADCYTRFYKYLYPKLTAGDRAFLKVRDENDLLLP